MSAAPATRRIALPDLHATARLAAAVAALARPGDAILLEGVLGAGKTAFARAFLRAASGDPALEVPSPTFTLVQSYATRLGTVHHFDLWRLNGPDALAELGWDEARDDIVLVEWPDRLGEQRPSDALTLALTIAPRPAASGPGPIAPETRPQTSEPCPDGREATLSGWPGRIGRLP